MRINFELLDIRAFLAILDLGGFHKAAETLNMSQPALSRRIQALETSVGAPLLERTTRRVVPTSAGRSFAPLARRLLGEFEDSLFGITGLGDRQTGQITLACVPTAVFYFLPEAIERFNAGFPHIRFRILDLSANDGLESVRNGEAEFGINFIGSSESDLTFTPLLDDPFVLACRHDHPLARLDQIDWKDLEGEPLIGVCRASGNRQTLENALSKSDVRLNFQYEVNHLTTSLGLVERGLGISVLPKLATPPGTHPVIVTRRIGEPVVQRTIGLVERRAARLSPAAQRFRDMLIMGPQATVAAAAP
ncbi:MAG TPA: LysR family transcriptional regulator [Telmatospirillum sp.]|nr:LysR family transcriptional regulator [Telmatospirillum sp.]